MRQTLGGGCTLGPRGSRSFARHWTQAPPLQTGVADGQSESARHATHDAVGRRKACPPGSRSRRCATHSTQVDSLVLHTGVAPEHSDARRATGDAGEGARAADRPGSDPAVGVVEARDAADRVAAKHRGAPAGQSESDGAGHALVRWSASQILFAPVQGVAALHPTQTPASGSQVGAVRGHTVAALAVVQAAWHWWSPGQHDGAEAVRQSAFVAQRRALTDARDADRRGLRAVGVDCALDAPERRVALLVAPALVAAADAAERAAGAEPVAAGSAAGDQRRNGGRYRNHPSLPCSCPWHPIVPRFPAPYVLVHRARRTAGPA